MTDRIQKDIFKWTEQDFRESSIQTCLKKVQPGDEVGTLRATRLAAIQARQFQSLVDQEEPE
jgi:hypothetical protein